MISKEKFSSLMQMDRDRRLFILIAMEYIEKRMEEILYNNDYWNQKEIRITFEDIFFNVFASEELDNRRIVTGWIPNVKVTKKVAVPEKFIGKSWDEIKPNCYEASLQTFWFKSLEDVLKQQNLNGWCLHVNWFEKDIFSERQNFKFY